MSEMNMTQVTFAEEPIAETLLVRDAPTLHRLNSKQLTKRQTSQPQLHGRPLYRPIAPLQQVRQGRRQGRSQGLGHENDSKRVSVSVREKKRLKFLTAFLIPWLLFQTPLHMAFVKLFLNRNPLPL